MEAMKGAKNYITEFLRAKKLFGTSEADELLKKIKGSKIRSNVKPDLQNAKKLKNTLPGPSRARSLRAETYTEANKDEADRCLDLAENYIIKGEFEKAEKLINKSKQLYPTSKADVLLKKIKGSKKRSNVKPDLQNAEKLKNTLPGPSRARSLKSETYTEANKDEAYRCLDLAENYIIEGDFEKAEKLIIKSKQLYPTSKADELLKKLKANQQETEAQLDTVKKINSSKDLYDVLGIKKDATHTEIKDAYKKLVLQVHPDKNHAPGATDAFKMVRRAHNTLTVAKKRKLYDIGMVGHEHCSNSSTGHEKSTSDRPRGNYDHEFANFVREATVESLRRQLKNPVFI